MARRNTSNRRKTGYTKNDFQRVGDILEADKIILGDGPEYVFSTDCHKTGINNNHLVVGGSGSGKTKSVAESILLESFQRSLIVNVTKREIVNKYKPLHKNRGYKILDLNFIHPETANASYDPIDYIKTFSDITYISRSIVMANHKKTNAYADPFFDEAAVSLLNAFIAYLLMTKEHVNFDDVLVMLESLSFDEMGGQIVTNYDDDFSLLEASDASNFAVVNWKSFQKCPMRTAGCVFSALNTMVDSVFTPEVRTMFKNKKKFRIEELAKEKTVLFVTTSPVNTAVNNLVNMFYGHIFKQLFEYAEQQPDLRLPIPVHILADEFATGCPIPMFDQYISVIREKNISVTMLIQSESQLVSLYGVSQATTIINNADTYLFLGGNDLSTAQNISLRVNKPLEDILYMKIGDQILFRRGSRPMIGKRYNILENETYKKVTAAYEKHIEKMKKLVKDE